MKAPLLLGQGANNEYILTPEITYFDIPAPYFISQNTSFIKNNKGLILIGKQNGILAIDGDSYFFEPYRNSIGLCLSKQKEIVYFSRNDFGYIRFSRQKGLQIISQIDQIRSNFQEFTPINSCSFDSSVFISTTEGVISLTEGTIKHFFFDRNSGPLFNSGKFLFLEMNNGGLYQWNGYEFIVAVSGEALHNNKVISIIDWEEGVLIFTSNGERFFFDRKSGTLSKKNIDDPVLNKITLLKSIGGDSFLAKTFDGHLAIYSKNNEGSSSNSTLINLPLTEPETSFVDNFGDLWFLFDFSLLKIEFPPQQFTLNLSELISETILSTAITKNSIFLGTNDGLYELKSEDGWRWSSRQIYKGKRSFFNAIRSSNESVYTAGNEGLYSIESNGPVKISEGKFSFLQLLDSNSIIAVNEDGLFLLNKKQDSWISSIIDPSIQQISSYVAFENGYWILTGDKRLIYLNSAGQLIYQQKNLELFGENRLHIKKGELLLLGEKSAYKYDRADNTFKKTSLSEEVKSIWVFDNVNEDLSNKWSVRNQAGENQILYTLDENQQLIPFIEFCKEKEFEQLVDLDETDEYLWLSGKNRLLRIDKKGINNVLPNKLQIKSVSFTDFRNPEEQMEIHSLEHIKYKKGTYSFKISDLKYQRNPSPYYRYKLTKFQEDWSDWGRDSKITFTNLKEGEYLFEVQALSNYGILSETESFSFTIHPPLYRSWFAFIVYFIMFFTAVFVLYKWRLLTLKHVEFKLEERIRERMSAVLSEKEKSDKLVADLFPKGTAEELKSKGRAESKKFEMATVLFSDIQGFTKIAEEMNPEVLIDELDKFFFHFDSVVDKYNIEKIKTIGDAYMAAGGIPVKNSSNPVEVVLAGLEMQFYMNDLKRKKTDIWDLRIGIHTGPVISGVVGHKKLSYDIWGDTVNTASRMESSGEGGKVNISGITYSHVKDFFLCEYRGKLPVKYKGNIDMYFVTGLRPELSVDLHGIPNRRFFVKLKIIRLHDIEERLFEEILPDQTSNLHFHKRDYLHRVFNQTELLGRSENISDDELLLTQTAAILLFSGLSESYLNFENKSVEIAKTLLPEYDYDDREIDKICNLILATKEPFKPQNILESILIDAKMEYFGRSDYHTIIKLLYLEEKNLIKDISKEKFIKNQISKLENFDYFTTAAQRLRETSKEDQINNLKSWK